MKPIGFICFCILIGTITGILENDFAYVELEVTSPVNGSVSGSLIEINFRFDFFNNEGLRVNPTHNEYILDIIENGSKTVADLSLTSWSAYYSTIGHGWLKLDIMVKIVNKLADGREQHYIASQKVDVYVVPSDIPDLGEKDSENSLLHDILTSLSPYYGKTATTVAIAIDHRSVAFESMMRLSPMVMEVFDWSETCSDPPNVRFAAKSYSWHNVHCDHNPIVYRAFYDVSVAIFTSSDLASSSRLQSSVNYIFALGQKTSGYLILMVSDTVMKLMISMITEESSLAYLLNPHQQFTNTSPAGVEIRILVYIDPFKNRLLQSGVTPALDPGAVFTADWKLVEHQRLSYLVVSNGCVDVNGELVLLTSPSAFDSEKPLMVGDTSMHSLLNSYVFLPFADFKVGSAPDLSQIHFVNASAALIRPYFNFHVAHFFQSIAGLLTLPDALKHLDNIEPLSYLLMPKFDSGAVLLYDWTTGVLSLVTQAYEDQQTVSGARPTALFAPQFHSYFQSDQAPQLLCYKELIVMGQASSFTGLFVNSSVHNQFRLRAYDALSTDRITASPAAEPTPGGAKEEAGVSPAGAFWGLATHKSNQYKLKVAFVLRWYNRRIVNLPALHKVLAESEMIDVDWLNSQRNNSKWRYLEQMSLKEQIRLFKEADLLIGAHGGAFANAALFMQPNSVMIEIMPSRFLDPSFRQIAYQGGLVLHTMFVTNHNQSSNCGSFEPKCLTGSLEEGAGMNCLGLRNCDVIVDVAWFEALIELSTHYIRANKKVDHW